jgi:hypothetical protein
MTAPIEQFECPHCGCKHIGDRGALKYSNDVQCARCDRWYLYAPLNVTRPLQTDQAEIARRKTAAPLKPKIAQKPLDFGLFGDDALQTDLVDLTRRVRS